LQHTIDKIVEILLMSRARALNYDQEDGRHALLLILLFPPSGSFVSDPGSHPSLDTRHVLSLPSFAGLEMRSAEGEARFAVFRRTENMEDRRNSVEIIEIGSFTLLENTRARESERRQFNSSTTHTSIVIKEIYCR